MLPFMGSQRVGHDQATELNLSSLQIIKDKALRSKCLTDAGFHYCYPTAGARQEQTTDVENGLADTCREGKGGPN